MPHCAGYRYTRNDLAKLLGALNYNRGVEIGVRKGVFSRKLCKYNRNLELFSIDPWGEYLEGKYYQELQDSLHKQAVEALIPFNATIIKKTSMEALADFEDESLDFAYIDGNHKFDYVAPDIIYWSQKVRKNGIVAVHDYYNGEVGVGQAVDAYTRAWDIRPWYVTKELQPTAFWVKP